MVNIFYKIINWFFLPFYLVAKKLFKRNWTLYNLFVCLNSIYLLLISFVIFAIMVYMFLNTMIK